MKVMAFLQNQWVRDPEKVKRYMASAEKSKVGGAEKWRRIFIPFALFAGCMTGRRLKGAFGEDLCDRIVWENASPEIGGKSSSAFPPDPKHIAARLQEEQPNVVLLFGNVAKEGFSEAVESLECFQCELITGPHPAARTSDVLHRLRDMARQLDDFTEILNDPQ